MTDRRGWTILLWLLAVLGMGLLLAGCGPKVQKPASLLDTPEHHTLLGNRLLEEGQTDEAGRAFEQALRLAPRYSPAHTGVALVKARGGDFPGAFAALAQAERRAESDGETVAALVGQIRVQTLSHAACARMGTECRPDDAWLRAAKEAWERALGIDPKAPEAHYFMGEAHLAALELEPAAQMFGRVVELKGDYAGRADQRWALLQKIQRALPGTAAGKRIALVERLTRADAAALLVEELQIEKLYARRGGRTPPAFQEPLGAVRAAKQPPATDIAAHPLRGDIEILLRIGARGLEVYPDGSFRPDEPVSRASYAMLVEDILVRATGDNALATRFIGSPSPFPDLRPDLPYFNAVMVVTSRGVMEAGNVLSGEFAPLQPVTGADALLVIRKIREALR